MKKSRMFLIFSLFLVVFFVLLVASPIFYFSAIDIKFYDNNNVLLNINKSNVLDEKTIINNTEEIVKNDYGQPIFLLDKNKFKSSFEFYNPYAKLIKIESIFPNKVVFCIKERQPIFYIAINKTYSFLLDREFKIVSKEMIKDTQMFIEISMQKQNSKMSFFDFFEISEQAFSLGMFITETNVIVNQISSIVNILEEGSTEIDLIKNISRLSIKEESLSNLTLKIHTKGDCGVVLQIENIMNKFSGKLKKLIKAFNSLLTKERIKTTYGVLKINNSLNCTWNKL